MKKFLEKLLTSKDDQYIELKHKLKKLSEDLQSSIKNKQITEDLVLKYRDTFDNIVQNVNRLPQNYQQKFETRIKKFKSQTGYKNYLNDPIELRTPSSFSNRRNPIKDSEEGNSCLARRFTKLNTKPQSTIKCEDMEQGKTFDSYYNTHGFTTNQEVSYENENVKKHNEDKGDNIPEVHSYCLRSYQNKTLNKVEDEEKNVVPGRRPSVGREARSMTHIDQNEEAHQVRQEAYEDLYRRMTKNQAGFDSSRQNERESAGEGSAIIIEENERDEMKNQHTKTLVEQQLRRIEENKVEMRQRHEEFHQGSRSFTEDGRPHSQQRRYVYTAENRTEEKKKFPEDAQKEIKFLHSKMLLEQQRKRLEEDKYRHSHQDSRRYIEDRKPHLEQRRKTHTGENRKEEKKKYPEETNYQYSKMLTDQQRRTMEENKVESRQQYDEVHYARRNSREDVKHHLQHVKQRIEEAKEATEEEPLEILDVHQYFVDDYDLSTLNDSVEVIDVVNNWAKTFEDKVQKFNGERYSLEYFVLDEKLMRLIEHLDKVQCHNDQLNTTKKIEVIQYIKKLHTILDNNAKDD